MEDLISPLTLALASSNRTFMELKSGRNGQRGIEVVF